jgi:hypothetical protein
MIPSSPVSLIGSSFPASEEEEEDTPPCVLERVTPLQAERLIRSIDSKLVQLSEELADAAPDSDDACLIPSEIEDLKRKKEQLVERLVAAPQKRARSPVVVREDEESPEGSQHQSSSQSSSPALPRRFTRSRGRNEIKPVEAPRRVEWWMELYHDFMYLWDFVPPVAPAGALNADAYLEDTEEIGKILIARGFPLIGHGKHTLTFLLTNDWVAKVARYGWDRSRDHFTIRHFRERNLDLSMSTAYPTCFAESRLIFVSGDKEGVFYRLYIQERLYGPFIFHGLDPDMIEENENRYMLTEFLRNNPDPNPKSRAPLLKQWGWTRRKRLQTLVCEGLTEMFEMQWLVCFDYQ